ncbi:JmjC domain, hydroxylase-domain-containing protein [Pilobolus umbonatus]|nr:JmjC domain, hydroxylase-domain-containing protein [Pilobolus umbonatus]
MSQLEDFKAFMEAIDDYGKQYGIVKVIPPKEWKDNLPELSLESVRIHKPIIQHILGSKGIFTQTNIVKNRSYTLDQWYQLCQHENNRPPNIHLYCQNEKMETAEINLAASDALIPVSFNPYDTKEYSKEYCKEMERYYWKNLSFNQAMYGADMLGSLFDSSVHDWNVNRLDNMLNNLDVTLPGVNSSYLYFGMWKATYAWHVEDMDLYSINYIHFGAPKQWYVIPPPSSKRFETFMQTTFFTQSKQCREFLRHKTSIVSPKILRNNTIPVQQCIQKQGEFIITFPYGYHSGYNLDFNCAESVNFALNSWIEIGKKAKVCRCIDDSVIINVDDLENMLNNNKNKKRKLDEFSTQQDENTTSGQMVINHIKAYNTLFNLLYYQCVLCVSPIKSTQPTVPSNAKYGHVHRICIESIDETFIDSNGVAKGIEKIPSARWKLTCVFCKKKQGACMQCCYGKCWRSFHATCALEHGATMNRRDDIGSYGSLYNGYCPQHDPTIKCKRKEKKESKLDEIGAKLMPGMSVYVNWVGGEHYEGRVVECNKMERICKVLSYDGITRKVPWRDIITTHVPLT